MEQENTQFIQQKKLYLAEYIYQVSEERGYAVTKRAFAEQRAERSDTASPMLSVAPPIAGLVGSASGESSRNSESVSANTGKLIPFPIRAVSQMPDRLRPASENPGKLVEFPLLPRSTRRDKQFLRDLYAMCREDAPSR